MTIYICTCTPHSVRRSGFARVSIKSSTNSERTLNSWQHGWTELHSSGKIGNTRTLSRDFVVHRAIFPPRTYPSGRAVCAINPIWLRTHRPVAFSMKSSINILYKPRGILELNSVSASVSRLFRFDFPHTPNPLTFRSPRNVTRL